MPEGLSEYWLLRMACPKCGDWNSGELVQARKELDAQYITRPCPTCESMSYMRTQVKAWTGKTIPFIDATVPDFSSPVQTIRLRGRVAKGNKKATGYPKGQSRATRFWGVKPEVIEVRDDGDYEVASL